MDVDCKYITYRKSVDLLSDIFQKHHDGLIPVGGLSSEVFKILQDTEDGDFVSTSFNYSVHGEIYDDFDRVVARLVGVSQLGLVKRTFYGAFACRHRLGHSFDTAVGLELLLSKFNRHDLVEEGVISGWLHDLMTPALSDSVAKPLKIREEDELERRINSDPDLRSLIKKYGVDPKKVIANVKGTSDCLVKKLLSQKGQIDMDKFTYTFWDSKDANFVGWKNYLCHAIILNIVKDRDYSHLSVNGTEWVVEDNDYFSFLDGLIKNFFPDFVDTDQFLIPVPIVGVDIDHKPFTIVVKVDDESFYIDNSSLNSYVRRLEDYLAIPHVYDSAELIDGDVVFTDVEQVSKFLRFRAYLSDHVYYGRQTRILESIFGHKLKQWVSDGVLSRDQLLAMTDHGLTRFVEKRQLLSDDDFRVFFDHYIDDIPYAELQQVRGSSIKQVKVDFPGKVVCRRFPFDTAVNTLVLNNDKVVPFHEVRPVVASRLEGISDKHDFIGVYGKKC